MCIEIWLLQWLNQKVRRLETNALNFIYRFIRIALEEYYEKSKIQTSLGHAPYS